MISYQALRVAQEKELKNNNFDFNFISFQFFITLIILDFCFFFPPSFHLTFFFMV